MNNSYINITEISFLNSNTNTLEDLNSLYKDGLFSDKEQWSNYNLSVDLPCLGRSISSRIKNRMSQLSLGVLDVMENGPEKNLDEDEELCLFTGFGEIETTDKIVKNVIIDKHQLVSPTLFHNSVHHTSLGYYTIIKKKHNSCITISDGLRTNLSFISYVDYMAKSKKKIVVISGDEYSSFFELDIIRNINLFPVFIAYRMSYTDNTGFRFIGVFDTLNDILAADNFLSAGKIIADKDTFLDLMTKKSNKELLTEYPLVLDSPCSLVYRLAMPFIFNFKGETLVIHKDDNKYYLFEVGL